MPRREGKLDTSDHLKLLQQSRAIWLREQQEQRQGHVGQCKGFWELHGRGTLGMSNTENVGEESGEMYLNQIMKQFTEQTMSSS